MGEEVTALQTEDSGIEDLPHSTLELAQEMLIITLDELQRTWSRRSTKDPALRTVFHRDIMFWLESIRFWRRVIELENEKAGLELALNHPGGAACRDSQPV